MNKSDKLTTSSYGTPDYENPEWKKGDIAKAMRFRDLPKVMQQLLVPNERLRLRNDEPRKPCKK